MIRDVPLTWAERSVWMASMLSANPLSYNAACILAIDGALSTPLLVDALSGALVSARLLSLRVVADNGDLKWCEDVFTNGAPLVDVREGRHADPQAQLNEIFSAAPIKADAAPLIAAHVLKHRPDLHYVMLRHHHVLLDFQGAATLLNRVAAIYNCQDQPAAEDRRAELALAEREYLQSELYHEDERYWRARMRGLTSGALSNPALTPATSPARLDLAISSEPFAAFASTARAIGSTPFQSLLMIAHAYLAREQLADVIFGVPLASRANGAVNSQSRMLPFRVVLNPGLPRQDAARSIRLALKADIERARFPIWQNTEAIFPGARRGALPKVALNFMRAATFRFGDASATIVRMLYGERNAETYIRCVEEADGRLLISLDSARDRHWVEGFAQALADGMAAKASSR